MWGIDMFEYKTLEQVSIEVIHQAFVEAFSDYQVKIDLPLWKLKQMLERRGYVPEKSMGVFNGNSMAGFILNGYRTWDGKPTAYDTGTGVIPEYRKQGLTTNMFLKLAELLKNQGVKQYLLEVLQQNTSAFELYKKQGFEITRSLACFQMKKSDYERKSYFSVEPVDCFKPDEWEQVKKFWDFRPSWQNSIDSVCAMPDAFAYCAVRMDSRLIGYGIIDKQSGDIPQLSVDKAFRGKGVASAILSELADRTLSDKLVMLNVEDSDAAMKEFLTASGFENYVNQYEMLLKFGV